MALLDPNPSLWMGTAPSTAHPSLANASTADVVVVGGGITGLTTALLLAQRGRSVALLESHRVAAGTTGFTTAKVTSLHGLTYAQLTAELGERKARLYGEANQAALAQVSTLVDALSIDCQLRWAPAYTYTLDPARLPEIEAEVAAAQALGLPADFAASTDLPYEIAGAVRFADQAHFHPRRYALGLVAALQATGGVIYEQSRVVDIDEDDGGVTVRTEGGELHAKAAVIATLLPFLDIGGYFAKAHPTRSYALAVRCRAPVPGGMYLSIDEPTRSVRPVEIDAGPGLVVGGGGHKPGEGGDTEARYAELEAWARGTFDVSTVEYRWSAQDYVTIDHVPYIGRCPRTNRVYVGTGFRKWGMTGGTVAAILITDLISGRANPWLEVFDATRVGGAAAGKRFVKENAGVGVHFVKDRIARLRADDLGTLAPGEGGIVKAGGRAVGAYRDPAGSLHAVSLTCTHLGCTLQWNVAETSWDCPCHGSRFTHGGTVIEGPATRPLEQVDVDE